MENDEIINSDENFLLGWISNKYHPMNNAILSKAVLHLEHTVLMTRNALNAAFKWFCRPFGTSSKWNDSGEGVYPSLWSFVPSGLSQEGSNLTSGATSQPHNLITSNL